MPLKRSHSGGHFPPSGEFEDAKGWKFRKALSRALDANRVFFVEFEGRRYYPAFLADPQYERRHIQAVCKILGDMPGGTKWQFFRTPKRSLSGVTPLAALAEGRVGDVKRSAAGFAEI